MKRWFLVGLLLLVSTATSSATPAQRPSSADPAPQSHVAWVMQSLTQMETIKPGMTGGDLLKVFTPDGGLQTGAVYVLRECEYFKVKVEFVSTRRPGGTFRIETEMQDPEAFVAAYRAGKIKTT
jgi:hypothetical protein